VNPLLTGEEFWQQTPEYARFRLMEGITYADSPDDLDEAVGARMQRQQVLYRTGKSSTSSWPRAHCECGYAHSR
jgi:hypothetical protein